MSNIRFVVAPLRIAFSLNDDENFKKEFDFLGLNDEDSVGEWLKLAKARGETSESDQVLLRLVVELHRKLDTLSAYVKGEQISYVDLSQTCDLEAIGYEHIKLSQALFNSGEEYYARIAMPIFPKREVPLFFKAYSTSEAKIVLMHEKDEKDYNAYLVARERALIREMRARL
ncbi:MAG: hypothetical protein IBX44_05045 [Sulfurospirillum sp.]|nr:hypothetical protein [Sulfurospirillum sp.]